MKMRRLSRKAIEDAVMVWGGCDREEAGEYIENPKMGLKEGMTLKQLKRKLIRHADD